METTQVWCEDLKGKHLSYGQMKVHSPPNSGQRRLTPGDSGTKVPGPPGTSEAGVPPTSSRPRWLSPKIPTVLSLVPESNTVLEPSFLGPSSSNRASGLLRCRWHSQESSTALHLHVFLHLTEGERSPPRTATALPGQKRHTLEPAQQAEAPKAALPRKLGRGLT